VSKADDIRPEIEAGMGDKAVRTTLIRNLYRQKPSGVLAHVITSGVLSGLLWEQLDDHSTLLGWLGALAIFVVVRSLSIVAFIRSPSSVARNPALWERLSTLFCGISGGLWALAPWLLMEPGETLSTLLVTVIVMGLGAGAAISLAGHLPACFAFVLPTQIGLIGVLAAAGSVEMLGLALLATYALIANLSNSVSLHRELRDKVQLSHDNDLLRREAEDKNLLLRTTLDNMSQGIALVDEQQRPQMSNQRLYELLEVPEPKTQAESKPLEHITGDGRARQSELHRPSGRVIELAEQPLPTGQCVITVTDITELKVHERELHRALGDAEQANRAKTRFLAAASHDLRQPIHALGLYFESLSQRAEAATLQPLIMRIDDAIGSVDSMLGALLDVSKLDAGVIEPNITQVDLATLLERLASELQPMARAKGNQLRIRSRRLRVQSDEVMLERVLRNLITNALRYTDDGRVLVGMRCHGDWVNIEVHDTGVGIPEAQQEEVFLEFRQLENPGHDRRHGLGLGLGLAIVKRIVDLLDHKIDLHSIPGRGSSFILRARRSPSPIPIPSKGIPTEALRQKIDNGLKERGVLLLDDDATIVEAMCQLFDDWGLRVIAAETIEQARGKLEQALVTGSPPELLLVDYRLRGEENGLQAIDLLRADMNRAGFDNHVPAALITGDTGPERLRQAQDSGHALLHKPVRPAALRSVLRQLLS